MAVEICVAADELKQTLEYISLISGTGAAKGKKKDKTEDIKQTAGLVKITAVSPRKDKCYLLMFECLGATEQLLYRMEGKSYNSSDAVMTCIEGWRLSSLAKTFVGDVTLRFEDNHLGVSCGTSHFKIMKLQLELPKMNIPKDVMPVALNINFLANSVRHCSVACGREIARPWLNCIQINLQADGKGICYATDTHRLARYVEHNTGSKSNLSLLMLPVTIQHIVEMCDQSFVEIIPTERCTYARTPRFDYQIFNIVGKLPDCASLFNRFSSSMTIVMSRHKLMSAVARASIMCDEAQDSRIKFASDTQAIYVESMCVGGSGLDSIPLEKATGKDDNAYNVSAISFSKILSSCASDSIAISTQGHALKPLLIGAPDSENSYILAPMR